jgi:isoleucyl-tRNA synthetase
MLEARPDWCISRQRAWGMPIPAFYNSEGKTLLTKESTLAVGEHFRKKGSDSWFTDSPKEILGENFKLPEGFSFDDLRKEENIFDVWFESGCSWHSVAEQAGWPVPVDMYLEGSDQHRGWFQLSLLPALGVRGQAPFKTVLTHGFTVDEKGMKQSKSLGNYVNALEEVRKHGADVIRLWVASVNYQEDMRCSDTLIARLQDAYRKIRNTLRYLLGNIDDFDPAVDTVEYRDMLEVDKWAMQQLQKLIAEVTESYETFAFHKVYGLIYNFCSVEMSSIYMDVLKDRMYCDEKKGLSRRSGQTAMYRIADALIKLLAPVLAHTSEEAWAAMKHKSQVVASVHLANMPSLETGIDFKADAARWQLIMDLRDEVLRALEGLRKQEIIASNQEASITVFSDDQDMITALESIGLKTFATFCIVSEVKLEKKKAEPRVVAQKSSHAKCQRCWNYWPSVGTIPGKEDLCDRCAKLV